MEKTQKTKAELLAQANKLWDEEYKTRAAANRLWRKKVYLSSPVEKDRLWDAVERLFQKAIHCGTEANRLWLQAQDMRDRI